MVNATSSAKKRKVSSASVRSQIRDTLALGLFCFEKCEIGPAKQAYEKALRLARANRDFLAEVESLTGLLQLADEALDDAAIERIEADLDRIIESASMPSDEIPALVWYCKAGIARHRHDLALAQRNYLRLLRSVRGERDDPASGRFLSREELESRGWAMLAILLMQRGRLKRSRFLAELLLKRFGEKNLKRVNGSLYLCLGRIAERYREIDQAETLYHQAHASFLAEHNWYYHLHVLLGYARLARLRQRYARAYLYLDLIDKAANTADYGTLRKEIMLERARLEQEAIDLLIDSRKCTVKTRDGGQISLGKQYVLLGILEALSSAHNDGRADQGLSKAEIIERVWHQRYRPESHDNKLYYNINRLRKLIEPDAKQPRYLLNWKEGYRLAPTLRVRYVSQSG